MTKLILEFDQNKSKVRQLADAIKEAILDGTFKEGDGLPSINKISTTHNLARDTVYKAFQDLKANNIIESAPTKGYFVTNTVNSVMVMLDIFTPYKEDFYKELIENLPVNYKLDLYFHHYNKRAFKKIILDGLGKYDLYLITNLANDLYSEVLDRLDNSKVLLIDFGKFKKDKFSYICQGFDTTLYDCLQSGIHLVRKYTEICFVFPTLSEHPRSCIAHFEQFCKDNQLKHSLLENPIKHEHIKQGTLFLAARHIDMIQIVKICRVKKYTLGKDIGIITFNDAPMLEVIENGITSISTDFKQMGKLAAIYLANREKIQTYIPTKLIIRGSL